MQTHHLFILLAMILVLPSVVGCIIWYLFVTPAQTGLEQANMLNGAQKRRIEALNADVERLYRLRREDQVKSLNQLQQQEALMTQLHDQALIIKTTPFVLANCQSMMDAQITLGLACQTWTAMKGIDPKLIRQGEAQQAQLVLIALQMKRMVEAAAALNGNNTEPLAQAVEPEAGAA